MLPLVCLHMKILQFHHLGKSATTLADPVLWKIAASTKQFEFIIPLLFSWRPRRSALCAPLLASFLWPRDLFFTHKSCKTMHHEQYFQMLHCWPAFCDRATFFTQNSCTTMNHGNPTVDHLTLNHSKTPCSMCSSFKSVTCIPIFVTGKLFNTTAPCKNKRHGCVIFVVILRCPLLKEWSTLYQARPWTMF